MVALTAVSMVPWPEIITTAVSGRSLLHLGERLEAVHAGHPDVEEDEVGRVVASRASASSPEPTAVTR